MLVQLRDGKADVVVSVAELVALLPPSRRGNTATHLNGRTIIVVANVTEAATGTVLSGNSTVACTSTKYLLTYLDITPTNFKPGLTVSAYVRINDRWPTLLRMTRGNVCPCDFKSTSVHVIVISLTFDVFCVCTFTVRQFVVLCEAVW